MNIAFVTNEVYPFQKHGGLADISASLPKALNDRGHNITTILPFYDDDPFQAKFELITKQDIILGDHIEPTRTIPNHSKSSDQGLQIQRLRARDASDSMFSMVSEFEEPKTVRFSLYFRFSGPPKKSPRKFPRISERCDSRYVFHTFAILGTKGVQIGKFNNRGGLITRGEGYRVCASSRTHTPLVSNKNTSLTSQGLDALS